MNALSPIVSEFETEEQANAYELWLKAKVEKALADKRPSVPQDEAMAQIKAKLEAKRPKA